MPPPFGIIILIVIWQVTHSFFLDPHVLSHDEWAPEVGM